MSAQRFVITTGEPAGIGPDIICQLWQRKPELLSKDACSIIINKTLLQSRAKQLGITLDCDQLALIDLPLKSECHPGKLNTQNASYVMSMLTRATKGCLQGEFKSIVTGPIHKAVLNDANFSIAGHTDFFTQYTRTEQTVMMLMTDSLKVALVTDHIPLNQVSKTITASRLSRCFDILLHDFKTRFHIANPRIVVCGLNPHAGEQGHLGTEETDVITPTIKQYQLAGHNMTGPIAADIAFTPQIRNKADVIVAMYHDQGLPALKCLGFHNAVNITLGLPFVRTSVDHGTALDIAGTGQADTRSLEHAILLAHSLTTTINQAAKI